MPLIRTETQNTQTASNKQMSLKVYLLPDISKSSLLYQLFDSHLIMYEWRTLSVQVRMGNMRRKEQKKKEKKEKNK